MLILVVVVEYDNYHADENHKRLNLVAINSKEKKRINNINKGLMD
jgi:hypothetical protein